MVKWLLTFLFSLWLLANAFAQSACCNQIENVYLNKKIVLDSVPVLVESIYILNAKTHTPLLRNQYLIQENQIIWKGKDSMTIIIQYKKIPLFITENTFRLDTHLIANKENPDNLIEYEIPKSNTNLDENDMNYQGSFSRGVSFGNNHDLVLNSGLNLQMDGIIGNDVSIKAAISDKSIPLQPEGNTQQLKEFDRLFIQIDKNENRLIAGDYDLSLSENHFLKYNKNLQGASFQNRYKLKNGKLSNRGSMAISKGNFQRQSLRVFEGNQGPYKLIGTNQETFIIVLANTEKVYLDGKLLSRGESKNYTIDYNQGEIFFTPKTPINANSRVVIEFEYATQNYLKSLYALDSKYENEKWTVDFHLFSEQESKNSSGLSDLSPDEKLQLAEAGDLVGQQFFSGIQAKIDPINPVFYSQRDTMVNGILFKDILVYTPKENKENKNVKFSNLGEGKGYYIRTNASANGTVFQWVAPDKNGNPSGNYVPVVKLIAPTKHQIYTLGTAYKFSRNARIATDISMSNFDKNRFSKKDKQNDIGWAWNTQYEFKKSIGKSKKSVLTSHINYEFVEKNYKAYSPFKNPEFKRNWNIQNLDTTLSSHFVESNFQISRDSLGFIRYQFNAFSQENYYQGIQQNGSIFFRKNNWKLIGNGQLLNASSVGNKSQFLKPNFDIGKTFRKLNNWTLGYLFEQEKNKKIQADTLSSQSFYFNQSTWYLESQKTENLFVGTHFLTRSDFSPLSSGFKKNIESQEYKILGNWNPFKSFRMEGSLIHRTIQIDNQNWTNQRPKKYQLGQANLNYTPLNGAIQMASYYEIGGGQEAKIAYNYLEVNSGQGVYQWLDYNQDSIQQINEFEIAPYPDQARYIRIILPTQSYIATQFLKFNQSLSLIPKAKWHSSKKKTMQFVNYFSTQSSYFVNRRTNNQNNQIDWNPLISRRNDSLLIADNQSIRNSFFFNRASVKFNAEIGVVDNLQKNILITGYEAVDLSETFLKMHGQPKKGWDFYLNLRKSTKMNTSENFKLKNYNIHSQIASLKMITLLNDKWRNSLEIEYLDKNNVLSPTPNKLIQKSAKLSITYNQTNAASIEGLLTISQIDYLGELNTPASFELLNGLQDGLNFLWSIHINKKLSKFVYLNIGYDGRKTGENKIIHLGNLQMVAQF